uniref:Uncharacterized protein n=1 Tax=Panagrolaimus sp. JU765 TaxID=591449 RepID=A0AC34RNB0_9BILA
MANGFGAKENRLNADLPENWNFGGDAMPHDGNALPAEDDPSLDGESDASEYLEEGDCSEHLEESDSSEEVENSRPSSFIDGNPGRRAPQPMNHRWYDYYPSLADNQ